MALNRGVPGISLPPINPTSSLPDNIHIIPAMGRGLGKACRRSGRIAGIIRISVLIGAFLCRFGTLRGPLGLCLLRGLGQRRYRRGYRADFHILHPFWLDLIGKGHLRDMWFRFIQTTYLL